MPDLHAPSAASRRAEQTVRIEEKLRRELGPQICGWLPGQDILRLVLARLPRLVT